MGDQDQNAGGNERLRGEALAAEFLAAAGADAGVAGQNPAGQPAEGIPGQAPSPSPLSGRHLVDYGDGVTREVDVAELVAAHRQLEELTSKEQAVKAGLMEAGVGATIAHQLSRLPDGDARKQRVLAILRGEDDVPAARGPARDRFDDLAEELLGEGDQRNGDQPGLEQFVRQLAANQQMILDRMREEEGVKTTRTLTQRVTDKLNEFPVIKQMQSMDAGYAVDLARDNIMNALAANPDAPLDRIVQQHVVGLNKMHQKLVASAVVQGAQPGVVSMGGQPVEFKPEELTGDALENGSLGRALSSRFRVSLR